MASSQEAAWYLNQQAEERKRRELQQQRERQTEADHWKAVSIGATIGMQMAAERAVYQDAVRAAHWLSMQTHLLLRRR